MMRTFLSTVIVLTSIAIVSGCSKKDESTTPDLEAPIVSILTPAQNDTVGFSQVTVVVNASDDIGVTGLVFMIDAQPVDSITAAPWQKILSISALADGPHTLSVRAKDDAGNVTTANVTFVKGLRSVDQVMRMSLCEIVTSANCIPCAPANEAYRDATNNEYYKDRLATVKYHAWFPKSTDSLWLVSKVWARPRIEYVFLPTPIANASAPNAWVSGAKAGSSGQNWVAAVDNDLKVPAEAKIDLAKKDSAGKVYVTVNVKQILPVPTGDYRLVSVVTESNIVYNDGNSENVHYDVMREMIPGWDGEKITLSLDQTSSYSREITIQPNWNKANTALVVFVQNFDTKHVLQAARIALQ